MVSNLPQQKEGGFFIKCRSPIHQWRGYKPSLFLSGSGSVSQSVGYDAGKKIKGRKRFMTVDTGRVGAAGVGHSR